MNQISEWVLAIMAKFGYFGIIFAMFAENVFPPIPSEIIMPAAGFAVARGDLNLLLVILAGTLGTVLGALPLYYLGSLFNEERLVIFTKNMASMCLLSLMTYWLLVIGLINMAKSGIFGRMVPGIRSLISIPAGMNKMPMLPFCY